MKKNKRIIIITTLIIILIILIILSFSTFLKKETYRDKNLYGVWYKKKLEIFANNESKLTLENFSGTYVEITPQEYIFCSMPEGEYGCEHYEYSAKEGTIVIENYMNKEEMQFTYNIVGERLIIRYDISKDGYYLDTYEISQG